jgi:hypothetical protein
MAGCASGPAPRGPRTPARRAAFERTLPAADAAIRDRDHAARVRWRLFPRVW